MQYETVNCRTHVGRGSGRRFHPADTRSCCIGIEASVDEWHPINPSFPPLCGRFKCPLNSIYALTIHIWSYLLFFDSLSWVSFDNFEFCLDFWLKRGISSRFAYEVVLKNFEMFCLKNLELDFTSCFKLPNFASLRIGSKTSTSSRSVEVKFNYSAPPLFNKESEYVSTYMEDNFQYHIHDIQNYVANFVSVV